MASRHQINELVRYHWSFWKNCRDQAKRWKRKRELLRVAWLLPQQLREPKAAKDVSRHRTATGCHQRENRHIKSQRELRWSYRCSCRAFDSSLCYYHPVPPQAMWMDLPAERDKL